MRLTGGALLAGGAGKAAISPPPNVIIILCDDLGYGDIHSYGSDIPTPNIDQMAAEGVKFDQCFSASAVCSPSRAALMTGRYPPRVGVADVIDPSSPGGLALNEMTMAQMLKPAGYSTMCVGKWHLGVQPAYLPTSRGFDQYWGIPYSNDQLPSILMQNTAIIESPVDLTTITQRYTQQATNFIHQSKNAPFFLYLAHTFPHIPLAVSTAFKGVTGMGMYADVVAEIDWSVGQVLKSLRDNGLDNNTLTIFTSDNGPWFQGSPGKLHGRKGWTYDGGYKEPFIARFPKRINTAPHTAGLRNSPSTTVTEHAPRTVHAMATLMDLMPTVGNLCGAKLPSQPLDGVDIWGLMTGDQLTVERDAFLYFDGPNIQCIRYGPWKMHVARYNDFAWSPDPPGGRTNLPLPKPELYNIELDPDESYDASDYYPAVIADLKARILKMLPTFPSYVLNAWNTTMAMKSTGYAGALPAQIP